MKAEALRAGERAGVSASGEMEVTVPAGARMVADAAYVGGGHGRQTLDLYLPEGGDRRPLIVYVHGGGFEFGDKREAMIPLDFLGLGYAVASLDYRLSGDAVFPAQIQDCRAAVRWLRARAGEFGLDPDCIIAWGESAGGHLVAMLGANVQNAAFDAGDYLGVSSRVQGVVDYFGPTDFTQMDAHALPGSMVHNADDSFESKLLGGPLTRMGEAAAAADPSRYLSAASAPFLVAHGDQDHTVCLNQSEILVAALRRAGVPVTYLVLPGADHCFDGASDADLKRLHEATKAFCASVAAKRR